MNKIRGLAGPLDQAFSSLSNGLIIYCLAVVSDVNEFGFLSLIFTTLAAGVGILRGALGTPLLLAADKGQPGVRAEGRYALSAALLMGVVVGGAIAAWAFLASQPDAAIVGIAAPFVITQDALRYVAIGSDRAPVAAVWDGIWVLGAAALLIFTWLAKDSVDPIRLMIAWTVLAGIALIGLASALRLPSQRVGIRTWWLRDWRHRIRFGLDVGLEQFGVLIILIMVGAVIDQQSSGALRGATAVLAPFAVLAAAIPLVIIPSVRRDDQSSPAAWRILSRVAVVTAIGALAFGAILAVLPVSFGRLVLGDTFISARPVIVVLAVEYALGAWMHAIATWLRAFKRTTALLTMRALHVGISLLLCSAAAFAFGTPVAVAVALTVSMILILTGTILVTTPWRDNPRRFADPHRIWSGIEWPALDWRTVIGVWTFVALGVLIPSVLIATTPETEGLSWLGPCAVIMAVAARFAWIVGVGDRRLFEMTFWVFTYVFMGLAPLAQIRQHVWPETVPRTDWTTVNQASGVVLVGIAAFMTGLSLARRKRHAYWGRHNQQPLSESPNGDLSYWRVVIFTIISIIYNLAYLASVGFAQFTLTRFEAYAQHEAVFGSGISGILIYSSVGMTILVSVLALLRMRQIMQRANNTADSTRRRTVNILLVVSMLLLADTLNPISNARYLSGTAILAVLASLGLFATAARFRAVALGFVASLVLIFPLADAFRYSSSGEFKSSNPLQSLLSADYDSFAQVDNAITIVSRDGLEVGRQFVGVLLWWFPRSLWTNKPFDSGILIANSRGYGLSNLSAPLWCEAYLNGGIIAVIIVFAIFGFVLYRWDSALDRQLRTLSMPGIAGCVMPFYMLILLRGSLLQAMSYLTVVMLCYLFVRRYPSVDLWSVTAKRFVPKSMLVVGPEKVLP